MSTWVSVIVADGGERIFYYSGPTHALRLGLCCTELACALNAQSIEDVCLRLPLPAIHIGPAPSKYGLCPKSLLECVGLAERGRRILVNPIILACLLHRDHTIGTDNLFRFIRCCSISEEEYAIASFWAYALRRHRAAALLNHLSNEHHSVGLLHGSVAGAASLAQAACDGDLLEVLVLLAKGENLEASGGVHFLCQDVGCCDFSPLACAASASERRRSAGWIVRLLLEVQANVDIGCVGPCGWTPLMLAAYSGNPSVCRLLVLAKADVRKRLADGRTALDIAGNSQMNDNARAIREARDERSAAEAVVEPKKTQSARHKNQKRSTQPSTALLAAARLQGRPQEASGRSGYSTGKGSYSQTRRR